MANGHTAALQLVTSEQARAAVFEPVKSSIDLELGRAVAAAAIAIAEAVADGCQHAGRVDLEIKERGAVKLAAVAQLALDHMGGDDDFAHKAREGGRSVLGQYFTDVRADLADRAINVALDSVFEIVVPVVKNERVYRLARMN